MACTFLLVSHPIGVKIIFGINSPALLVQAEIGPLRVRTRPVLQVMRMQRADPADKGDANEIIIVMK